MIALITHDKKKAELLEFARGHVEFFRTHKLWMVLLAGDQAEEQMWTSLAQSDANLCVN